MTARWKTIRIFISSTFRDMHAERDHLVNVVFPELRERLEKHRIHLIDIDLRWGVTREQADNDQALGLCLDVIDECRPFFVGILGERYGWVPESFPRDVLYRYGWTQHYTGRSITALEIVHGVLRNPEMRMHGFFYFRDPSFMAEMPPEVRQQVEPENAEAVRRLDELKEEIRRAGTVASLRENYRCRYAGLRLDWRLVRDALDEADRRRLEQVAADGIVGPAEYAGLDLRLQELVREHGTVHLAGLETFGDRVRDDLWAAVRRDYPEVDSVDVRAETAQPQDWLAEEQDYHERFIESRSRVYVGREGIQETLRGYVAGESPEPTVVFGPPGCGKSALLGRLYAHLVDQRDSTFVLGHFVGASPQSTGLCTTLRRSCLALRERFALTETVAQEGQAPRVVPREVPEDAAKLVTAYREFLEAVPEGGRVVIIIDALNQMDASDRAHELEWLPHRIPAHVRLVLSCTEGEAILGILRRRGWRMERVEPLTRQECSEIVTRIPSLSSRTLDAEQVDLLLSNPATTNPLFLLVALEELRGFGSFEHLNARIRAFPHEGDPVAAVFGQVLERLERTFYPEVVRTVTSLVAASRYGLSEAELQELLRDAEAGDRDLFPVLRQLRAYLLQRGELADFYHVKLREAVEARYLAGEEERTTAHGHLARYFRGQADPAGDGTWRGTASRPLSELPHHLVKAKEPSALIECFRNGFLELKRKREFPKHELKADFLLAYDYFRGRQDLVNLLTLASLFAMDTVRAWTEHVESYLIWQGAVLTHLQDVAGIQSVMQIVESQPSGRERVRMIAELLIGLHDHPQAAAFLSRHRHELERELHGEPPEDGLDLLAAEALGSLEEAFRRAGGATRDNPRRIYRILKLVRRRPDHQEAAQVLRNLLELEPEAYRFTPGRNAAIACIGLLTASARDRALWSRAVEATEDVGFSATHSLFLAAYLADDPHALAPVLNKLAFRGSTWVRPYLVAMICLGWFAPALREHWFIKMILARSARKKLPKCVDTWQARALQFHLGQLGNRAGTGSRGAREEILIPVFALWARLLYPQGAGQGVDLEHLEHPECLCPPYEGVFGHDRRDYVSWIELGEALVCWGRVDRAAELLELLRKHLRPTFERSGGPSWLFVLTGCLLISCLVGLMFVLSLPLVLLGPVLVLALNAGASVAAFLRVLPCQPHLWMTPRPRACSRLLAYFESRRASGKGVPWWLSGPGWWEFATVSLLEASREDLAEQALPLDSYTPEEFFLEWHPWRWFRPEHKQWLRRQVERRLAARAEDEADEWLALFDEIGMLPERAVALSLPDAGTRLVGKNCLTLPGLLKMLHHVTRFRDVCVDSTEALERLSSCLGEIAGDDDLVEACILAGTFRFSESSLATRLYSDVLLLGLQRPVPVFVELFRAVSRWRNLRTPDLAACVRREYVRLVREREFQVPAWFDRAGLFELFRVIYRLLQIPRREDYHGPSSFVLYFWSRIWRKLTRG